MLKSLIVAGGLPFTIEYEQDGEPRTGVPGGTRPFVTADAA